MSSSKKWVVCRMASGAKDALRLVSLDGFKNTEDFFVSKLQAGSLSLSWVLEGIVRNYVIIDVAVNTSSTETETILLSTHSTQLVDTSGAPCIVKIKSKPEEFPEIEFFRENEADTVTAGD